MTTKWQWIVTITNIVVVSVVMTLLVLALVSCGPAYEDRIEQKYDINVLSIEQTGRSGGTVVYQKKNGEICSAAQLSNDVLVESGCGEVMEGEN